MHHRSVMGREMALGNLDVGPHKGSQAKRLGVTDAPPDPKQTKLSCYRCLNYLTAKTTPMVLSENPLVMRPRWNCYTSDIQHSTDPCSNCPICTRDDNYTNRRVHLCQQMLAAKIFTPILLPVRLMLNYAKAEPGCQLCGFKLDHIVCECPYVYLILILIF